MTPIIIEQPSYSSLNRAIGEQDPSQNWFDINVGPMSWTENQHENKCGSSSIKNNYTSNSD